MKTSIPVFSYLIASMLLTAGTALAAAEEHGAHGSAEKTGGLPQLDPTWYASQLFWLVVTFAFLYAIFARKILPALSNTIENRHEHVQNDLTAAEKQKAEAEKIYQAYEETLEKARLESSEFFAKAEQEIKEKTEKRLQLFKEKSDRETKDAEKRIADVKKAAMKEMDSVAAEIASKAAESIVGISTDPDDAKTFVRNISQKAA